MPRSRSTALQRFPGSVRNYLGYLPPAHTVKKPQGYSYRAGKSDTPAICLFPLLHHLGDYVNGYACDNCEALNAGGQSIFRRHLSVCERMPPVDVRTNSGLFRTWCADFKNFEPKSGGQAYTPSSRLVMPRPLPHLGAGAFLVTAFVSTFFVADLTDALAVIVGHSWHAYFHEVIGPAFSGQL